MENIDVHLENVTVRYGEVAAVQSLSLAVRKGEFVALLGPSGCGKTTTLRVIAGLIHPDEGNIYISRRHVNDLPIEKRRIGMVFQNYALWPHLTVYENVAFGLQMAKIEKGEIRRQVERALKLLKLPGFEARYPYELSGGQQQRVALARAIVVNPAVLLLDEPLGALDKKLREEMQIELKQLQRKLGITTIFVTHDQEEALTLADRIAVMDQGVIEQLGTPSEVYESPRNRFVANFIGLSNFLQGKLVRWQEQTATCEINGGEQVCVRLIASEIRAAEVEVVVRPEKMRIVRGDGRAEGTPNLLRGVVANKVYTGIMIHYYIQLSGGERVIVTAQNLGDAFSFEVGEAVGVCWSPEDCRLLERKSASALPGERAFDRPNLGKE